MTDEHLRDLATGGATQLVRELAAELVRLRDVESRLKQTEACWGANIQQLTVASGEVDRLKGELARAENRLRNWKHAAQLSHDNRKPLVTDLGHCAGCFGWHPHPEGTDCVVGAALAKSGGAK